MHNTGKKPNKTKQKTADLAGFELATFMLLPRRQLIHIGTLADGAEDLIYRVSQKQCTLLNSTWMRVVLEPLVSPA